MQRRDAEHHYQLCVTFQNDNLLILAYYSYSTPLLLHTHKHSLSVCLQVRIIREQVSDTAQFKKTLIVHLSCAKLCFRYCLVKRKINNISFALKKHLIIYQDGNFHGIFMHILSFDFHKCSMDLVSEVLSHVSCMMQLPCR